MSIKLNLKKDLTATVNFPLGKSRLSSFFKGI